MNENYKLTVECQRDDANKSKVLINGEYGFKDPWMDLGLMLEGVGLLINTVKGDGKTEHNGMPLDEYINDYIDRACADYKATATHHRSSN
jgi:hypothetical protein